MTRRRTERAIRQAAAVVLVLSVLAGPGPVGAVLPELSTTDVQDAIETGTQAMTQEDFGEEWHVRLPGGEEIVVSTPFSRLALAARQAALKGEPLTDKQRQEQIDRGKDRIQLVVTLHGRRVDFARYYQAVLRVGNREVKATFNQNERTALRLDDGRFAARNIYVFPFEGLPPRGTITLVVRTMPDLKEVFRAPVDLSTMR